MITIAVINRKGGVGKTITTTNLGYNLSQMYGKKVLLVDADSQRDLSKMWRVPVTAKHTIYDVLTDKKKSYLVTRRTQYKSLNIIPGDERLEILNEISENALLNGLEIVEDSYDFCIIDCPPSMQISTVNALIAADYVISPMKLDAFSSGGVFAIDGLIEQCREYNPDIEFMGALITMYRSNKNANNMVRDLVEEPPFSVMDTVIRFDTAVDRSTVVRKPLAKCASRGKAAADYMSLAKEVIEKAGV